MNYLTLLSGGGQSGMVIVIYIVVIVAFFYFMIIRPQKKQTAAQEELMKSIKPGDSIMTTGGFYGTVIDVTDDETVIVEFGNNKNCRIPMHKKAIAEVEKPVDALQTEEPEEKKPEKKSAKIFGKEKADAADETKKKDTTK